MCVKKTNRRVLTQFGSRTKTALKLLFSTNSSSSHRTLTSVSARAHTQHVSTHSRTHTRACAARALARAQHRTPRHNTHITTHTSQHTQIKNTCRTSKHNTQHNNKQQYQTQNKQTLTQRMTNPESRRSQRLALRNLNLAPLYVLHRTQNKGPCLLHPTHQFGTSASTGCNRTDVYHHTSPTPSRSGPVPVRGAEGAPLLPTTPSQVHALDRGRHSHPTNLGRP